MIEFILNNNLIKTDVAPGSTLLDFVRYHQHLKGTKIGCREGDCGACTLLVGELINGRVAYKSLTSCITPLGNIHGKHVVSIEGLNLDTLTPYQQAMVDTSGSQCGMCTVGFIVSFAGACLSEKPTNLERMISAIDGNICRCTGYKSIERAAAIIVNKLKEKPNNNTITWLVNENFIPQYFIDIPTRLHNISPSEISDNSEIVLGGGTDLLVQQADTIHDTDVQLVTNKKSLEGIFIEGQVVLIKGGTNTTALLESEELKTYFPNLWKHIKLVSSTPIRNIATVAGNLVNASPIGDLTAFFMALNTCVNLQSASNSRTVSLNKFYTGYKQTVMTDDEFVSSISFNLPDNHTYFNFEKVSKRRYLDIATVNTAICLRMNDGQIEEIHLSAGGVGPTPKYLNRTCAFLRGKVLSVDHLMHSLTIAKEEISPISDVRGSEQYKRLLLRQLILAHFIELFPAQFQIDQLT